MALKLAAAQYAALVAIFAEAGPGKIPGSWLTVASVSYDRMDAALSAIIAQGTEAYSWGNHALAGYLTSESDPVFSASPVGSVSSGDVSNWNTAFSWGNHALFGYLTLAALVELDPVFTASPAFGIGAADIVNWNTAFGWGDHATAGYLSSASNAILSAGLHFGVGAATGKDYADVYLTKADGTLVGPFQLVGGVLT